MSRRLPRVLVTGAAGHIGARLVSLLSGRSDVLLRSLVRTPNLAAVSASSEVLVGDLRDRHVLVDATADCDVVVHLASVSSGSQDRDSSVAVHGSIMENLLSVAAHAGVARIVHLSTIHVYGRTLCGLVDETTPTEPLTPYGQAHLAVERIVSSFDASGMSCLTLRCANGLGLSSAVSSEQWSLVAGDLCYQAVKGRGIRLQSHGRHQRDFITLTDLVRAIEYFALGCTAEGILLLGSGRSITLRELAELVAARAERVLGTQLTISCDPTDTSRAVEYQLDTARLSQSGFTPTHDVESEIDALLYAATRLVRY